MHPHASYGRARTHLARLCVGLLAAALMTSCSAGNSPTTSPSATPSGASPSATATTPGGDDTGAALAILAELPKVGDCWANDTETEPVPCDAAHVAETVWVTDYTGAADAPSMKDIEVEAETTCREKVPDYLGSRDWTATRLFIMTTDAVLTQAAAGARWTRCDVLTSSTSAHTFQGDELTSSLAGVLASTEGFRAFRRCVFDDGGGFSVNYSVLCTEPHHYEAVTPVVDLGVLGIRPSDDVMDQVLNETCPAAVDAYLGASRDDVEVLWLRPGRDWDQGMHDGICFVQTTEPVTASLQNIGNAALPVAG